MADEPPRRPTPPTELDNPSASAGPPPGWKVTPRPTGAAASRGQRPPRAQRPRWLVALLIVGLLGAELLALLAGAAAERARADPLQPDVPEAGQGRQRQRGDSTSDAIQGTFKQEIKYPRDDQNAQADERFSTQVPSFANGNAAWHAVSTAGRDDRRQAAGHRPVVPRQPDFRLRADAAARRICSCSSGGAPRVGRRRRPDVVRPLARAARSRASEQPVTFDDVAGIDEAKEELTEIVDFLKNPDKYLQARRPDPARRAAQRARPGPARRCSRARSPARRACRSSRCRASEFVEMIVGVGASRVRDLFQQAKEAAPAIIFIDELDAIGRSRASGAARSPAATTSASRRSTRSSPRWTGSTRAPA